MTLSSSCVLSGTMGDAALFTTSYTSHVNAWKHLTVTFKFYTVATNVYWLTWVIYQDGTLLRSTTIAGPTASTVIFLPSDRIIFGPYNGKIAGLKVYSPGSAISTTSK